MGFQSIAKNSVYLITGQVIAKFLAMVSLVWLARYLSIEEYGLFNYALSFWAIVMLFLEGGMGALAIREVARDHSLSSIYLTSTFLFKIILGVITFPLIVFVMWILDVADNSIKIRVFLFVGGGQYIMQIIFITIIVFFRAHEAFRFEAILSIVGALITAVFTVGGILMQISFENIVLLMFIANVLVAFVGVVTYWNKIEHMKWVISRPFLLSFFYATIPFFITFIVGGVSLKIPVPLLEKFSGTSAVAIYSASMRIVEGFMFIPSAVVTILYPFFSRSFKEGKSPSSDKLDVIIKALAIVGVPLIIYSFFFKNEVISVFYSAKYLESAVIWPLWVLWFFIWSAKSVLALFVLANDKQKAVVGINVTGLILTLVLSVILIPRFSYLGATLTMLIAESVMFVLVAVYVSKMHFRVFDVGKLLQVFLVNAVLVALAVLTGRNDPIVTPVILICIYAIIVSVFDIITPDEKKILTSLFRKTPNS